MESMQRLFGRDIANQPHQQSRDHSLVLHHKPTINIHPNNSFKITKQNHTKE